VSSAWREVPSAGTTPPARGETQVPSMQTAPSRQPGSRPSAPQTTSSPSRTGFPRQGVWRAGSSGGASVCPVSTSQRPATQTCPAAQAPSTPQRQQEQQEVPEPPTAISQMPSTQARSSPSGPRLQVSRGPQSQ